MRHASILWLLCLSFAVTAADTPEFENLQASYRDAIEQATKDLREAHLRELEKLRDAYTRAGNLNGANKVQGRIDAIYQSIAFARSSPSSNSPPAATLPPEVRAANTPDLDRAQDAYDAVIEKATKGTRDIYLRELQKLHDNYTRNADLTAANKTQAEMDKIRKGGGNARAAGTVVPMPEVRWIAGQDWVTDAGTLYAFGKNGVGNKSFNGANKTPFTWQILSSGLVEIIGSDTTNSPKRTWWAHFKNRSDASYGTSPNNLNLQMHSR